MRRRNKYNATKTEIDGYLFDSRAEARRYQELKLLERVGEIQDLQLQPRFVLQDKFQNPEHGAIRAIQYKADFKYIEKGETIIEDVKGMETPVFKIKRKLFLKRYPELRFRIT